MRQRIRTEKRDASELEAIIDKMAQENKHNEDNFAKSKQSVTIEGWVARDKDGIMSLFQSKPERHDAGIWGTFALSGFDLPTDSFPDLKWSDEPLKVKITIEEIECN